MRRFIISLMIYFLFGSFVFWIAEQMGGPYSGIWIAVTYFILGLATAWLHKLEESL